MFSIHEPAAIRVARAHDAIPGLCKLRDSITLYMGSMQLYSQAFPEEMKDHPDVPPYQLETVKKRNKAYKLRQWKLKRSIWAYAIRRVQRDGRELQEALNALRSDVAEFKEWVQGIPGLHFRDWLCPLHKGNRVPAAYTGRLAFGLEEAVPKIIAELDALLPLHQDFLDDIPDEYWQEVPTTYRTEGSAYK